MLSKNKLLLLIAFSVTSLLPAQKADSLLQVIQTTADNSLKATLYLKVIIEKYSNSQELLATYKKGQPLLLNYPELHATASNIVAWGLIPTGDYEQVDYYFLQAQSLTQDSFKIHALNADRAYSYHHRMDFIQAEIMLLKSIRFFERQEKITHRMLANNYTILGLVYSGQGKTKQAEKAFLNAKKHATEINLKVDKSIIDANLGFLMLKRGRYPKALTYLENSIGMVKKPEANALTKAEYFLGFAQIYNQLQLYNEATFFLEKTEVLAQEINNTYILTGILLEQLQRDLQQKELINSEILIDSISSQLEQFNHHSFLPLLQEQQIIFHLLNKDTSAALHQINCLLQLALSQQIRSAEAKSYLFLSAIYQQIKQDSAIQFSLKALKIAADLPNETLIEESYQQLAKLYEQAKHFQKAIFYHKELSILQDTIKLTNNGIQVLAIMMEKLSGELEGNGVSLAADLNSSPLPSAVSTNKYLLILLSIFVLFCGSLWLGLSSKKAKRLQAQKKEIAISDFQSSLTSFDIKNSPTAALQDGSNLVENDNRKLAEVAVCQSLVNNLTSGQIDWTQFLIEYEQLHPIFINQYRQLDIKHSSNKLRHFICLRLNLSLKETASLLQVSISAVKSARRRLRQQLNLPPDESLQKFIMGL